MRPPSRPGSCRRRSAACRGGEQQPYRGRRQRLHHGTHRLALDRPRVEHDEANRVAFAQCHANFGVAVEAANAWAVASPRIDNNHRRRSAPHVLLKRVGATADDPQQPLVGRRLQGAAIKHLLGFKVQQWWHPGRLVGLHILCARYCASAAGLAVIAGPVVASAVVPFAAIAIVDRVASVAAATALVRPASGATATAVAGMGIRFVGAATKRCRFVAGSLQRGQHRGRGLGIAADARGAAREVHLDRPDTRHALQCTGDRRDT